MDGYEFLYLTAEIKAEPVELCHIQVHTSSQVTPEEINYSVKSWCGPVAVVSGASVYGRTARNVP